MSASGREGGYFIKLTQVPYHNQRPQSTTIGLQRSITLGFMKQPILGRCENRSTENAWYPFGFPLETTQTGVYPRNHADGPKTGASEWRRSAALAIPEQSWVQSPSSVCLDLLTVLTSWRSRARVSSVKCLLHSGCLLASCSSVNCLRGSSN